jgi:hypothetical protein
MTGLSQIICRKCGTLASEGKTLDHAEALAVEEGFIRRPKHWLCGDCGGVKKMVTTDTEHYKKFA